MKKSVSALVIGLVLFAGFIAATALVVSNVSQSMDLAAAKLVNQYDLGSIGTSLMIYLTNYGREVVWSLLVVVMFVAGGKRTKLLAVELAILFVVGIVIGDVTKSLVGRPRPDQLILRVPAETDPSYPSGHALIVSIGAAFCLASFRRRLVAGLLTVDAALVSYSRVYVGVHYPLDVVGGVLLGSSIGLVGILLVEKYLSAVLSKLLEPFLMVLKEGPLDI